MSKELKKYYYIVMSQKQMLENEVLEEILRERASYYFSKKRNLDFWVVISPDFIKSSEIKTKIKNSNFYAQQKNSITYKGIEGINKELKNYDFYSALISSDIEFIKWIKLRLGYFENISDEKRTKEIKTSYISDGIYGTLEVKELKEEKEESYSPLQSNKNFLHPDILLKKYKKALEIYYLNSLVT
jgi:hypothetical protein